MEADSAPVAPTGVELMSDEQPNSGDKPVRNKSNMVKILSSLEMQEVWAPIRACRNRGRVLGVSSEPTPTRHAARSPPLLPRPRSLVRPLWNEVSLSICAPYTHGTPSPRRAQGLIFWQFGVGSKDGFSATLKEHLDLDHFTKIDGKPVCLHNSNFACPRAHTSSCTVSHALAG